MGRIEKFEDYHEPIPPHDRFSEKARTFFLVVVVATACAVFWAWVFGYL